MAEKKKASKNAHEKLLELARSRYQEYELAWNGQFTESLECVKFVDGEQWPESVRKEREDDGRPCLVINKMRKFVKRQVGQLKQNRPSMDVKPIDDFADVEGAEVRKDLLRSIEQGSNSDGAYDNGMEGAIDGGFGFCRIIAEYPEDSFNQEIKIKSVPNRFTILLDMTADEYTFEDGKAAFISETISKKEFEEAYPNAEAVDWAQFQGQGGAYEGWYLENKVRIAEYFYKDPYTRHLALTADGMTIEIPEGMTKEQVSEQIVQVKLEELTPEAAEAGIELTLEMVAEQYGIVKDRKQKAHKVMWCKISGNEILEGPKEIPSDYIPIVPFLGHEVNIEGKRKFRGLIYDAMDSARMYNYWRTHATEIIALAPKAPYKITPEQIAGWENMWANANKKNLPYLVYNDVPNQQAPTRERQVEIPTAVVNEAAIAENDIKDTQGTYEASLGEGGNERSGRAIMARQKETEATTFTFPDNFLKSIEFASKICLNMIPRVMDNERIVRLRGDEGKEIEVKINTVIKDPDTLEEIVINDLSIGKYDMIPSAGASYETKRQMMAASMLDFVQFVPEAGDVIGPRLAEVMDWPNAKEIAEELRAKFAWLQQQEQPQAAQQ